ncbi:MAG: pyridoxal-phosphate dependent enzyme [Trueperaceae bacterium]|nr:pyridoxal-phosphate dependent enzyme [Trueperaceae bacterium]
MSVPTLEAIREAQTRLAPYLLRTPVHAVPSPAEVPAVGDGTLFLKLEFLQRTGTFKARGALNTLLTLPEEARARGVTAVSAGNHAIAVAYAAAVTGISAKVVMHRAADPVRVAACERHGAEVILADDIGEAFARVDEIRQQEGRTFVHPFDGERTREGTGTVGLEIAEQIDAPDVVLVAVGGGGLLAGIGAAIRALHPSCEVIGVEPEGAPGLTHSLAQGAPLARVDVDTVADSMGAPMHTADTFEACRVVVDRMVLVSDDQLCRAMAGAYDAWKFALEPAGAATLAAAAGPLRSDLEGRRVVAVLCGSNIGEGRFMELLARGRAA